MADDYRPFNGEEQESMYALVASVMSLEDAQNNLSRRLRRIDRGEQKLKTSATYINNVFDALIAQMSREQRNIFKQQAKQKRFRIISQRVAQGQAEKPKSQRIVWEADLRNICNAAWQESCMMCGRKGTEAKQCPLKKSLDNLMIVTTGENPDCWYKPEF